MTVALVAILRAERKRGILRRLWRAAPLAAVDLEGAIIAFQDQQWQEIKRGIWTINVSGGGHSMSRQAPELFRGLSPEDFFDLSEQFLALRSVCIQQLTDAGLEATDDNVFQAMMQSDELATCRSYMGDHTLLRWPTWGMTTQ